MKALVLAKNYIKYLAKAKNEHSLHSPFLFDLYTKAVKNKAQKSELELVEKIRTQLLDSNKTVDFTDYGAGSHLIKTEKRYIKNITKICSKSKKEGRLLHNIVEYFKPQNILELGTSVGISALYIANGNPAGKMITLEGSKGIAEVAAQNFKDANLNNVEVKVGEFSETLDNTIQELQQLDFVYIDGNHKKEPTLQYFEKCLPHLNNESIVVFDDIHWTADMEKAWDIICKHPKTTACLDFFHFGVVFLRKELTKETHVLKY